MMNMRGRGGGQTNLHSVRVIVLITTTAASPKYFIFSGWRLDCNGPPLTGRISCYCCCCRCEAFRRPQLHLILGKLVLLACHHHHFEG